MLGGIERSVKARPFAWMLLAVILLGTNAVISKYALGYLEPLALASIRNLSIGLLLALFFVRRLMRIPKALVPKLAVTSLISLFVSLFYFIGLSMTSALSTAVFVLLSPIWVYLGSVFFLKEPRSNIALIGSLISLTGGILLIGAPALEGLKESEFLGNLLISLSFLLGSINILYSKFITREIPVATMLSVRLLFTGIGLAAAQTIAGSYEPLKPLDHVFWLSIGYMIIFVGAIALMLYYTSLKYMRAEDSAPLTYLDPLTGVLLSVFILGDSLSATGLIATAVIVTGVLIAHPNHVIRMMFYESQSLSIWRKFIYWIEARYDELSHQLKKYF